MGALIDPNKDNKNDQRTAYVFDKTKEHYVKVDFMDIKRGDIFVLIEPDGTPVANLVRGSVASIAVDNVFVQDGVEGVRAIPYREPSEIDVAKEAKI